MGYMSEVVIVVPKNHTEKILDIIPEKEWDSVSDSEQDDYQNKIKTTIFYMSYTKWYPSTDLISGYPDVDKIMEILSSIDEIEGDSSYAFVRSGEDLDDLEEKGDPHKYGIFVTKSISF
jgi:hypothetical protein|tara:strand:+ start:914 stop:1270 length:357 start_codon:yes stop_codon:yes gene_type:complete